MSFPFFQLFTVTLNPTFDITCLLDGLEPGRINRVQTSRTDPGGKGINLSRVFARFQPKSLALGIAGEETASLLQKRLEQEGVVSAFFTVPGAVRENMTYLLPDHREYKVNQPGPSLPSGTLQAFLPWMEQHISGGNTVIAFAGSLPDGMSGDEFVAFASHFQTKSRLVLDTSALSLSQLLACRPWVIKPNLEELEQLMGRSLNSLDQRLQAAQELIQGGVEQVLVSLGEEGLLGVTNQQALLAKVPKVSVCSTVGAGDSALAGFLLALSKGESWSVALRLAASFGTAAVATEGTNPPDQAAVQRIYSQVTLVSLS